MLTDDLVKILLKHPGKKIGILGWCEKCQDDLNGGIIVEEYDELYGLPAIIISHSCTEEKKLCDAFMGTMVEDAFFDNEKPIKKPKKPKKPKKKK